MQLAVNRSVRWRVFLVLSLLANLILAGCWIWSARVVEARLNQIAASPASNPPPTVRTAVIMRKQFFSWQEVESDDYPTFIKNLRDIACPEQTIRDIIIADVNTLYARRRALEVVTADQQWWRPEPDTNTLQLAAAKSRELDQERRDLLTTLLGPSWETGDLLSLPRPTRPAIPLDGPVLGALPMEVKLAVEQIALRAGDRLDDYLAAQRRAGKPAEPAVLARLRADMRRELAGALAPAQLEEFLLRYSDNARGLRAELAQLKAFNTTPEEFRAMFRAIDPINEQLAALDDSTAQGAQHREALLAQGEAALKLALGEKRYEQYRLLHDSRYRDAVAEAARAGTPESAMTLYEIKLAAAEEQERIKNLTGLTDEQRAIEQKKAELEQLKAVAEAVGQEVAADPAPQPKPPPPKVHQVLAGEGLGRIALLYSVDPGALQAANPTLNFNNLRPGDKVTIPGNPSFQPPQPPPPQ
jgi:LysM repeat protein